MLSKNKKVILGVAVVLMIVFFVIRMGKRKVGYWRYKDSARIYYSPKSGDILGFATEESYNQHRASMGLPLDFSGVDSKGNGLYENPNGYYKKGDTIVVI